VGNRLLSEFMLAAATKPGLDYGHRVKLGTNGVLSLPSGSSTLTGRVPHIQNIPVQTRDRYSERWQAGRKSVLPVLSSSSGSGPSRERHMNILAGVLRDSPVFPGIDVCNGRPTQVINTPKIRHL
jgi:hypothetical protein